MTFAYLLSPRNGDVVPPVLPSTAKIPCRDFFMTDRDLFWGCLQTGIALDTLIHCGSPRCCGGRSRVIGRSQSLLVPITSSSRGAASFTRRDDTNRTSSVRTSRSFPGLGLMTKESYLAFTIFVTIPFMRCCIGIARARMIPYPSHNTLALNFSPWHNPFRRL